MKISPFNHFTNIHKIFQPTIKCTLATQKSNVNAGLIVVMFILGHKDL